MSGRPLDEPRPAHASAAPPTSPRPGFGAAAFRRPGRADGRVLLGVCAGLARRWDLESRTVRVALGITLVPFGAGLLVYAALALVMPADGASDADIGWRSELARSMAQALVVLAVVLAVGGIAAVAVGLAVFGLGPLALLLATATLVAVITIDHPRTWLLGIATLALGAPAAVVELTDTQIARQAGAMRVAVTRPQDVDPAGYRAGLGPMLLDLRDFDAEERTVTTVRARADLRTFVVALPSDRCFHLEIDYVADRSWLNAVAEAAQQDTLFVPSALGYRREGERALNAGTRDVVRPSTLVAYGRAITRAPERGRYRRAAPEASAPTIRLRLESGRSQIIVRDYPLSIDPLADPQWPLDFGPSLDVIDTEMALGIREGRAEDSAVSIGIDPRTGLVKATGRPATRALGTASVSLERYRRFPDVQSRRVAGACASSREVRAIRTRLERELMRDRRAYAARRPRSRALSLLSAFDSVEAVGRLTDRGPLGARLVGRREPGSRAGAGPR